ncbi:hypothetical protein [uncultured Nostoc sp.]|uniref:hypothetical protein n=1 Tax=uncultured Nostoc sp. TaxID=340711 RepID=UPI0035CB0FCC
MSKIYFYLYIWLKQHRIAVGGMLVAIAITGCNASVKSQPPANTPSVANLIASSPTPASVSPTQSAANTKPPEQQAVQVIRDYYSAIARLDYKQAYSAWDGNGAASKQSFEQFKQGFANTTSVAVEVGKPGKPDPGAGSIYIEIPVTVTAIATNGTPQRFRGSYVLRRVNDVPGSTPEQRRWHLYSAKITPVK